MAANTNVTERNSFPVLINTIPVQLHHHSINIIYMLHTFSYHEAKRWAKNENNIRRGQPLKMKLKLRHCS